MHEEIITLQRENFIANLSSDISDLLTKSHLSDVTLVSDDEIPLLAHKYVLSAASPVMKDILINNPHSHPLIYLRGVKHQDMQAILQLIYFGEATFSHGNIDSFIEAAKDFQIKQMWKTTESSIITEAEASNAPGIDCNMEDNYYMDIHAIRKEDAQYDHIVSSVADEMIDLCSSDMQVYEFIRRDCLDTQEVNIKEFCIPANTVNIRQHERIISKLTIKPGIRVLSMLSVILVTSVNIRKRQRAV